MKDMEIVICAAVKTTDGKIIRGHRHHHCIRAINDIPGAKVNQQAQGFITSRNRYFTREEGLKIQKQAGIKSKNKDGYSHVLFSEDLY